MYTSDEDKTNEEDEFVNINQIVEEGDIPSVLGGSFSTTTRGIKPKRVKSVKS